MKMNRLEKYCMNNPVRAFFLRRVEAPLLEQLGGRTEGAHVLEVGCGSGASTEVILRRFGPARVEAFDLDPGMVAKAKKRLARIPPERVSVSTGDVTAIDAPSETYDAVFNFAILHHIPEWRQGVKEIHRVLKPGGKFFFEEVTEQWTTRWPYRSLFDHPREARFTSRDLLDVLEREGFILDVPAVEKQGGDFVFGVARKVPALAEAAR